MSEYIVRVEGQIPDAIYERELIEIVRCRDCKHFIDGECMVDDGNGDYLRLAVPPEHFCAWGERDSWVTCKCGEEIELGDREYAICPSCGRMVRE